MKPATPVRAQVAELPVLCLRTLLDVLMTRAAPHLTHQELEWLDMGVPDLESSLLSRVEELTEGLGCLVADGQGVGSFQDAAECSRLLFFLSNQASLLGGLRVVSDTAAHKLKAVGGNR